MAWTVVGSSPSAAEWMAALGSVPDVTTITTNRGIRLWSDGFTPNIYFFGDERFPDPEKFTEFRKAAVIAQQAGTRIVGLSRSDAVLDEWDIRFIDEFVTPKIGCWRPWKFRRGLYTAAHLSGLFCLQYAVNKGARSVNLVGMEGYGDSGHYFDGAEDSQAAKDANMTAGTIQPFTQAVVNACPDVEFVFYGKLNYKIHGPNVTQYEDIDKWNSTSNDDGEDSGPTKLETCPTEPQIC